MVLVIILCLLLTITTHMHHTPLPHFPCLQAYKGREREKSEWKLAWLSLSLSYSVEEEAGTKMKESSPTVYLPHLFEVIEWESRFVI